MILDTNAVSALLAGDPALEQILEADAIHHLPVVVIGEYRYGLARSRHRLRLERLLDLLAEESIVLPIDIDTAKSYSSVREGLQKRGTPIPENDVWIAALAIQHDLQIASRDQHFDAVSKSLRLSW